MCIKTAREVFLTQLSELRQAAERSFKVYEALGQAAHHPDIKAALDEGEVLSGQNLRRLDECFRLMGEKPVEVGERVHDVSKKDLLDELSDIKSLTGRRIQILSRANQLMHFRIGEYFSLIAASEVMENPLIGVILGLCLDDSCAFSERTRLLIREQAGHNAGPYQASGQPTFYGSDFPR